MLRPQTAHLARLRADKPAPNKLPALLRRPRTRGSSCMFASCTIPGSSCTTDSFGGSARVACCGLTFELSGGVAVRLNEWLGLTWWNLRCPPRALECSRCTRDGAATFRTTDRVQRLAAAQLTEFKRLEHTNGRLALQSSGRCT